MIDYKITWIIIRKISKETWELWQAQSHQIIKKFEFVTDIELNTSSVRKHDLFMLSSDEI